MARMDAMRNGMPPRLPAKWMVNHIQPGKRLKLRDDVYRQIKEREWILNKIDSEGVHLLHESRAYGLIVRMEDIDWSETQGRFTEKNPSALRRERDVEKLSKFSG